MKRITTFAAMVLIGVGSAFAQLEPTPPSPERRPADMVFLTIQAANELLSNDIVGHPVVNMADETLGEVEELAFTQDGRVTAVVIGVGGFLGIGQKNVAVPFELLERRVGEDGVATWRVDVSREAVDAAPPYIRMDEAAPAEPAAADGGPFVPAQAAGELLLDDLRGRPVVSIAGDTLGAVNAIVFSSSGQIVAAVVGVGGFLGIGQKDVAIAFAALEPVVSDNGDIGWRFEGNAETLAEAPDFTTQGEAEAAAIGASAEAAVGAGADGRLPAEGFGDLAADVTPAVVSVRVRTPSENSAQLQDANPLAPFFERFGIPETQPPAYRYGEGSGFFISADGFVVTNNHVVEGADQVVLLLDDGTTYPARVVGTDPRTDIALLKVDAADRVFEFVTFAEEPARIGDWILAVGNPFGLGGTVTLGIVSALGRDIGAGPYDDFMQIDAAINQGNSGGPAFNLEGEVIGVNAAIASPTGASVGIGFAIPADIVIEVIADLQDDGVVQRGWLGVQIQAITPDIAEALGLDRTNGALVVAPEPDGPAARAGVLDADVVLAVNGEAVEDPRQLARLIASYDPGEEVQLTAWRDGAEITIDVVLGELPGENRQAATAAPAMQTPPAAVEGIGLAVAPAANLGEGRRGVVVAMVDANGTAAQAGLQPGDLILEVEGVPVDTPDEFAGQLAAARDADRSVVLLRVSSGEVDGLAALRLH